VIRKYQPADREDVLSVWADASAVAHPFLSHEFLALERHNIPNVYLPKADTWVWEADGRVVGFMSLLGNEVGALFVDPGTQRAGIGRALIGRARALRGELEVEVFKDNVLGRAFYAKCGFEVMYHRIHEQTGLEIIRLRLAANTPQQPTGCADG
jgi:putative acetyltransferase